MSGDGVPYTSVPLPQPRKPTAHERALMDALLVAAPAALRAQAEVAMISEVCSCGCPSITFAVPDDAPRASDDPLDLVRYEATAVAPDGRTLDVVLHACGGVLFELEVWAGTRGGDPRTELPDPARLTPPTASR